MSTPQQPAAARTPPNPPAKTPPIHDTATLRRIRRGRVGRDLLGMAFGIGLIVYYTLQPKPDFYTGGGSHHSFSDSSFDEWALLVGSVMVVGFGILALVHRASTYRQRRKRGTRWCYSVVGLALGAYLIVAGFTTTGLLGAHTTAHEATACHRLNYQHEDSHWVACDVIAHWPDGTTSTVDNVPLDAGTATVTVVRPAFSPWPFAGDEHEYQLGDLCCLLAFGLLLAGQALFSIGVLLLGHRPRGSAAATG